jgi:hypothetical protein
VLAAGAGEYVVPVCPDSVPSLVHVAEDPDLHWYE